MTRLVTLLLTMVLAAPAAAQDISTFVLADDGTPLATDVYSPPFGPEPWPVLLIRTPYDKSSLRAAAELVSLFAIAVVTQDTRGRFASGGADTVFRDDGDDGRATVRWIVDQAWCNGTIGSFGGSAFAITEYLMAPAAELELRSLFSVAATPDLYAHAFIQGGALRESLAFNWLEGQGSLHVYDEILQQRLRDEWWTPVEVLERAAEVNTAGLHIGGWYDIFSQGTLDAFTSFAYDGGPGALDQQYLVMGPWTHGTLGGRNPGELNYPANAVIDVFDLILPWLSSTLYGEPSEVDSWPPVRIYLMGAVGEPGAPGNEWLDLERWPPAAESSSLYLTAEGELEVAPPLPAAVELTIDPSNPVPTLGGANLFPDLEVGGRAMGAGPHDQQPVESYADVLVFTTEPLRRPLTVMGRVRSTLWIRPDTTDLDLAVRLTDVYPDGRSMLVLDGIQRARMRCGDDRECFLTPGVSTEIEVDLWSTAIVFNAGHRIRVSVSGTNAPRFEVNPNHGGDLNGNEPPVIATPQLLLGADHPSRLVLPTIGTAPRRPGGRVPADRPGARAVDRKNPAGQGGVLGFAWCPGAESALAAGSALWARARP